MHKVTFTTVNGNEMVKHFATKQEVLDYIDAFGKALRKGVAIHVTADSVGGLRTWIHGEAN